MTPRGIRNNNPFNLRKGGTWRGLADVQSDPAFAVFAKPFWGLRAGYRILHNYQKLHGLNTVKGVIHRFAPSEENDTEAYVADVLARTGWTADQALDLTAPSTLVTLGDAIIHHENGQNPYTDGEKQLAAKSALI